MSKRIIGPAAFVILLALQTQARAQDVPPTLLIQIRSLDAVMENVKLLVTLSGRENAAEQIEGLIKSKIGPKGLEGIDPARPFGVYGRINAVNDAAVVVLVPIADENAFLNLLKNLNVEARKNDRTGLYTITGLPIELYFRFSEKYAYVSTLNLDALEKKNLLPPGKVFRADQKSAITMSLRLDQLPKDLKFEIMSRFETGMQEAQNLKLPDETPAQKALRLLVYKQVGDQFKAVLEEGEQLGIDLNIDDKSKQASLTFSVAGKPDSPLAKNIAQFGKTRSLFANLHSKEGAVQGSVTLALPKEVQKLFGDTIDEAQTKILTTINSPARRKQTEELLKGLSPTFKAGELDAAFSLQGPDGKKHYNMIAGVKIQEGAALNKVLRSLLLDVRENMKPQDRDLLQLDFATVAGATIHRFDLSKFYEDSKEAKEMFGDGPLVMAVSDNAWYLAIGPEAMLILRQALTRPNDAHVPPLSVELSLARLWPLIPAEDKNRAKLQELFPAGKEGRIRLSVDGGSRLTIRVSSDLSLVQVLGLTEQKK